MAGTESTRLPLTPRLGLIAALLLPLPRPNARESDAGRLERAFVAQTVAALADVVEREYFAPEAASRVARALRSAQAEGRYDDAGTPAELAKALTRDLQAEASDKHLAVAVVQVPPRAPSASGDDSERATRGRRDNFGVRHIEILAGNVGYLDIRAFYRPDEARDTIGAAMRMLKHADALILDLRENGGGSPGTVALLASYLFEEPGLPLFTVLPRSGRDGRAYATEIPAPAERDPARPVFALTAAGTFSAGEGLAFLLQERHRLEVVGERTAGAANPGRPYPLNERLEATVPNGRVASAVSGRNWEGRGVTPDVPVAAAQALRVAHARALRELLRRPVAEAWQRTLRQALADLEAKPSR